MNVPAFLSHLRTDRRGLPVPYVNKWGGEDVSRIHIRECSAARMPGLFDDDADEKVPDFTRQNMQRQRECIAVGLCQVCGRRVPWKDRVLVLGDLSTSTKMVAGTPRLCIAEPWLDLRCARFALAKCPALIRRRRDEQLRLVTVSDPSQVDLIVSVGWVEGLAGSETVLPAMWMKISPKRLSAL